MKKQKKLKNYLLSVELCDKVKGVAEKLNLPESFLVEHILSNHVDDCLNDPKLDNNGKPKRGKK